MRNVRHREFITKMIQNNIRGITDRLPIRFQLESA